PTRCCATRRSAQPTTSSATRGSIRTPAWALPGPRAWAASATSSATFSARSSAADALAADAAPCSAAPTCATTSRSRSSRRRTASKPRFASPAWRYARAAQAAARAPARSRAPARPAAAPDGLYVRVHRKPRPVVQRDEEDLHCEMPVSFSTAALGGDIGIPTLDGTARIRVPAETETGKTFRLKGKGIKGVRSHLPGDLFCHVAVETPVSLTERQRQLLREFESISQQDSARHNPRAKSWLDKVKEFFEG